MNYTIYQLIYSKLIISLHYEKNFWEYQFSILFLFINIASLTLFSIKFCHSSQKWPNTMQSFAVDQSTL